MLELDKRKNQNNGPEFGIRTNEGEFIISHETGKVFIGCFENQYNNPIKDDSSIKFKITNENQELYQIFSDFIDGCNRFEYYGRMHAILPNWVGFTSAGCSVNEASRVIFVRNDQDNYISVIFEKSKFKHEHNSYFVDMNGIPVSNDFNLNIFTLLDRLLTYSPTQEQIAFEDILNEEENGISRVRCNNCNVVK